MPQPYQTLPTTQRLRLALLARTPAQLAQTVAALSGQIYDRAAFDALARRISNLYDAENSRRFRACLDRQLCDRHHGPVAWDIVPDGPNEAA